jgi:UPF0755 protein
VSDVGLELRRGGHRKGGKPRRRGAAGCLAVLVALAILLGGGYYAATTGIEMLQDRFSPPPDYPGPGTGSVLVQVQEGQTAGDIAVTLKRKDVVKSVEAFTEAARQEPKATGIQVGFYELHKHMPAAAALEVLVNPDNLIQDALTIPEGWTVDQIVARLAKETEFSKQDYRKVLRQPQVIGLPEYADGNPEGYLFPATYMLPPDATAESIITSMVDRWRQAAKAVKLEQRAEALGYSPAEVMVVASLVEAEASREQDRAKVARVIYNRLEGDETNGLLQIDATVNYAHGRNLGAVTSLDDLEIDSPYNTYKNPGLPPTPIEAPGQAAMEAAANPAEGDWYYYVTVNLRTGKTKFAETYDEFLRYKRQLDEYCDTQSQGAC